MNLVKKINQKIPYLGYLFAIIYSLNFLYPFILEFGWLDRWLSANNWRIFFSLGLVTSFISTLVIIGLVIVGGVKLFIKELKKYNNNLRKLILNINVLGVLFMLVSFVLAGIVYLNLMGLPFYKDLREGLKTHRGSCSLNRRIVTGGPDVFQIIYKVDTSSELKLDIDKADFFNLAGEDKSLLLYKHYDCIEEVQVLYAANFSKVIEVIYNK